MSKTRGDTRVAERYACEEKDCLIPEQLAVVFDVDIQDIETWCNQGQFPTAFRNKKDEWRIPRQDLIERLRCGPAPESLTPHQLAAVFGRNDSTIRSGIKRGRWPGVFKDFDGLWKAPVDIVIKRLEGNSLGWKPKFSGLTPEQRAERDAEKARKRAERLAERAKRSEESARLAQERHRKMMERDAAKEEKRSRRAEELAGREAERARLASERASVEAELAARRAAFVPTPFVPDPAVLLPPDFSVYAYYRGKECLYIGQTRDPYKRAKGHSKSSIWYPLHDYYVRVPCDSELEMDHREKVMIRELNPTHNEMRYEGYDYRTAIDVKVRLMTIV